MVYHNLPHLLRKSIPNCKSRSWPDIESDLSNVCSMTIVFFLPFFLLSYSGNFLLVFLIKQDHHQRHIKMTYFIWFYLEIIHVITFLEGNWLYKPKKKSLSRYFLNQQVPFLEFMLMEISMNISSNVAVFIFKTIKKPK